MRQGKDHAAAFLKKERGSVFSIQQIAFADALRKEVHDRIRAYTLLKGCDRQIAYKWLCRQWHAKYDHNAPIDSVYVDGKQRALLQAIGQGRREQEPDYWVNKWMPLVAASTADIILVTDLRYPNEFDVVKAMGGITIRFTRIGYINPDPVAASHISETALDGYKFDHDITVNDGEPTVLECKTLELFDYLTRKTNFEN